MIWIFLLLAIFLVIPSIVGAIAFGKLWSHRPIPCLTWCMLAPIVLTAKLVVITTSPVVAAISVFARWEDLFFPFAWMSTHDDTVDGEQEYEATEHMTFKKWWYRTCWLCRNPAYSFMFYQLGRYYHKDYVRSYPHWNKGKAVETAYTLKSVLAAKGVNPKVCVQARGKLGPLYVWVGWKLHNPYFGKSMFALHITKWNIIGDKL